MSCGSFYSAILDMLCCAVLSHSVMSSFLQFHGLWPARLLCPWGFLRQEYWSGLPCPSPGNLPNPVIEPKSPALQVDSLLSEPPGKPKNTGVSSLSLLQWNFPTQGSIQGLLHCRRILYQLSYLERKSQLYDDICYYIISCIFKNLIYKKRPKTYPLSLFYSNNNQVMYVLADYLAKCFSIKVRHT